jgi:hypothetical protein
MSDCQVCFGEVKIADAATATHLCHDCAKEYLP